MNDKKIALLLPSYVGGGAEKISDILFSRLMRQYGYSVELITGQVNDHTRERAKAVGYQLTDLSEYGPDINDPKASEAFLQALKRSDAKHIVYSVVMPNEAARYRHELADRNIIYHLHSMPLWEAREHIYVRRRFIRALDSTRKYLKWYFFKYLKEKWFKVYSRRYARRYRKLYAYVDHIVVLTESYRRELEKILGTATRKNDKITAIYNPFDPATLLPLAKETKSKEILYVGRLSCVDKGIDNLLLAWHRICRDYPDWKLKIVGDGPDRGYLEWLAYVLSIQGVEFCGYTSDPAEHLKTASILCLTSNFEGWGMVLVEAMAAGVVPLAVNCSGGVEELLADGRGLLVPNSNGYVIAKGLRELIDNPQGLEQRRLLYPEYLKNFDAEIAVKKFKKLLQ